MDATTTAKMVVIIATVGDRQRDNLRSGRALCRADRAAERSQIAQRHGLLERLPFEPEIRAMGGILIAMATALAVNNWQRAFIGLSVYSLAVTIAFVWLLGRSSVQETRAVPPAHIKSVPVQAIAPPVQPVKRPTVPKPTFPKYQSTVPLEFRGNWDEIVSDKCEGREARFYFGARNFMNFEVDWEVTKVKLYSPTEMDLHTTLYDENKNQVDEVWQFRLVDGGKTLTSRKPGGSFFKKCPT